MPAVEDFIEADEAAQLLGVSKRTFRRYADGDYGVKLRTAQIGRRRVTTKKWLSEFIKQSTEEKQ